MYDVCMRRINLYVDETELQYLKTLTGKLSTHIRIAISDYIKKLAREGISSSQSKGSEKDG